MTVIAFDGKTLAADRQWTRGDAKTYGTKIYKIGDSLYGFTGNGDKCIVLREFFTDLHAGKCPAWPDFQKSDEYVLAVEIKMQDCGYVAYVYDQFPLPRPIEAKYHAIGSGGTAALAAMHTGASAEQAVLAAIHHVDGCGGTVDTLTL